MIKTLLFDNNGVITTDHEEEKLSDLFSVSLEEFKAPHKEIHISYALGKSSLEDYLKQHKEAFNSVHELEIIKKTHFDSYLMIPEMKGFVKGLKNKFELAMLTNFGEGFAEANLVWNLGEIFDEDKIFVSSKIGMLKPDPDCFLHALKELKRNPEEVVFIDDRVENVEVAEKLGLKGIVFKDLTQFMAELDGILEEELKDAK